MNHPNEDQKENFSIENDSTAEWAVEKIKEAAEERDRLLALISEKEEELARKKLAILERYENSTSFLLFKLREYMGTVKVKSTKTQDTYQLLSGKLVRKKPAVDYYVDKEKLLKWLDECNRADLIKVERTPIWVEIKKHLLCDTESGLVTMEDSGEVIEGVTAIEKPETFDIKF